MATVVRFPRYVKGRLFGGELSLFALMRPEEQRARVLKLIDQRMSEAMVSALTGWSVTQIREIVALRAEAPVIS